MAKFCGNCGAKMEDNAKVCGMCGTSFGEGLPQAVNQTAIVPEKADRMKKFVKLASVLIAVILVIVIALNAVAKFTGYNGLVHKVMNAYEDYDINALISMASDVYYYVDDGWGEAYLQNSVGDCLDTFNSEVGHNYKLSYVVDETYAMSGRQLDSLLEEIEDRCAGFDISTIKKVMVADVTLTAKQGNNSSEQQLSVVMTKEGRKWKLFGFA